MTGDGQSWRGDYVCPGCRESWWTTWHRDIVWQHSPEAEALAREAEPGEP